MQISSDIGETTNQGSLWINSLSDDERRGLLLLQIWENERSKSFGGYRKAAVLSEQTKETSLFKQAATVAKWLCDKGFQVGLDHINWRGYIKFAIADFQRREQTPILGWLKNDILLGRYCAGGSHSMTCDEVLYDDEALEARYAEALAPQLAGNIGLLMLLGLRRTKRS